jgi:nuclear cap-binding protein subunit 1
VRTALLDILDIFEVNRKECARLLLEYPKWNLPGTFKPKPGVTALGDPVPGKDWQLESTIIEVRFPNPISNDFMIDLLGCSRF